MLNYEPVAHNAENAIRLLRQIAAAYLFQSMCVKVREMNTQLLITVALLASASIAGCGSEDPNARPTDRMVYVDTETQQPVVHEIVIPVPAVNPETGKRTLMPGLYCPTCNTWYPVPSADQINTRPNTGQCPKDKTPLIADGPWPGEDSTSENPDA